MLRLKRRHATTLCRMAYWKIYRMKRRVRRWVGAERKRERERNTSSLWKWTPATFTMFLDVIYEFLVFLLGPCSFVGLFLLAARLPHRMTLQKIRDESVLHQRETKLALQQRGTIEQGIWNGGVTLEVRYMCRLNIWLGLVVFPFSLVANDIVCGETRGWWLLLPTPIS